MKDHYCYFPLLYSSSTYPTLTHADLILGYEYKPTQNHSSCDYCYYYYYLYKTSLSANYSHSNCSTYRPILVALIFVANYSISVKNYYCCCYIEVMIIDIPMERMLLPCIS